MLSPKSIELVTLASKEYGVSKSEVIESCIKHTLKELFKDVTNGDEGKGK